MIKKSTTVSSGGVEENDVSSVSLALHNKVCDSNDDCREISCDVNQCIEKHFEFLKNYVTDVDRAVLYSLLLSEMDNTKGLETIMRDVLGIPDAADLILQFENAMGSLNREVKERKESQKTGVCSRKYWKQISEMFPDADPLFLQTECREMETELDCARFINTVMITGAYTRKKSGEYLQKNLASDADDTNEVEIIRNIPGRPIIVYSSDEEIASSGIIDDKPIKRKRRKTETLKHDQAVPSTSRDSNQYDEEIVDIPNLDVDKLSQSSCKRNGLLDDAETAVNSQGHPGTKYRTEGPMHNFPSCAPLPKHCSNSGMLSPEESRTFRTDQSPAFNSDINHEISNSNSEYSPYESYDSKMDLDSSFSSDSVVTLDDPEEMAFSSLEVSTTSGNDSDTKVQQEEVSAESQEYSEEWVGEKTVELIRLFPNTDPSYLRAECVKFKGSLDAMNEFVLSKLERNDMPSRADYEKRMEMEELQNRYTTNFSIEDFLKVLPDPWDYFRSNNRNCSTYKLHSLAYLKAKFRKHYSRVITKTLMENNFNLYLTYLHLKSNNAVNRVRNRCDFECNVQRPTTINIQFLQEVAFIENESKIENFIEAGKIAKRIMFEEAKRTGNLLECECCFDDEVMIEDSVYCPSGHCFCKACVIKYVEVEMGQAKCQFSCLAGCGEKYTLNALQKVLKPEVFSKIIQANQIEEIKAAGIEDLVHCPFCNYATIMPPEVKIMVCLNPECQRESCRLCKELSHIPLRCDEVEKSEEVKMRTFIENKMTEALVRTCYKCGKRFVKEEGCNKMVCNCGAMMCYVCRKPVKDYSHFNGQGGTEYEKCPLYSTNDELHVDLIVRVAQEAKAEVLQANPDKILKHDPTMVLPERSYERPVPGMNAGAALAAGLLAVRGNRQGRNPRRGQNGRRRNGPLLQNNNR